MQPRTIEANTLRDIEASVSEHNVTRTQVVENAAMFCDMLITAAPSPSLLDEGDDTLRSNANKKLGSVTLLVLRPCFTSGLVR